MTKERLAAFFDAVLAIIMTILVLELEKPSEVSLKGFLALKENFFAYTLSFFWLGISWINHHNEWIGVKISEKTLWGTIMTLFFSSFFPYSTAIVSKNFHNTTAQLFYGIIIIGVTVSVIITTNTLIEANKTDKNILEKLKRMNLYLKYDLIIKIMAFLISAFFYPPAIMIALLFLTLVFVFLAILKKI